MNILEIFGILVCPIFIIIFLFCFKKFEKNIVVDIITTILFVFSIFFCIYFNIQVRINYFNVFVYAMALIGHLYLCTLNWIESRTNKIIKEIKDKIDKCEYSVRLDVNNRAAEIVKEFYSVQKEVLETYNKIDRMTFKSVEELRAITEKNKNEVLKIADNLENIEGVEDGEDFTNTL